MAKVEPALQFLNDGIMGARIQAFDWCATPLGPIETWPNTLRVTLSIILRSKMPTYLLWGPDLVTFYNDACLPLRGIRSEALGRPLRKAWADIWDVVAPLVATARRGEAIYIQDVSVDIVQRKGYQETTWWNASCSPVVSETGDVDGILIIVHETTERILGEKRLRFLVDLSTRLRGVTEAREAMAMAADMLGLHLMASRVGYAELNAEGDLFTVERDWTQDEIPTFAGQHRLGSFGPLVESELRAGRAICIEDVSKDPRTAEERVRAEFLRTGKYATIVAPLIRDARLVAMLFVHQMEPRHWREDEVTLVQEVAERTWTSVLRARAETALRESEERFRQFAEHSSNVLWILNLETRKLEYLSTAYEAIWGEPVTVALDDPDHWIQTLHPEDRDQASAAIKRASRGEESTQEYHIARPDGGVRWIRHTFFPIQDEQGRVRWAGGIAQDLTEHDGSTVYVVDGNEASRRDLCLLLQGAGYGVKTFDTAQSFLEVESVLVPGCVVIDIRSPAVGELTIPKELKARRSGLPVIVIGETGGHVALAIRAMKAGAVDFLDVPYQPKQLLEGLAAAQTAIQEREEQHEATERMKALVAALPTREREVLDGLLAGGTNKTIARNLGLSPRTVEAHRARIMERLGAQSLPELVQIAVTAGLQPKP